MYRPPTVNINMSLIYVWPGFKGTNPFDDNLFIKKQNFVKFIRKGFYNTKYKIESPAFFWGFLLKIHGISLVV